MGHEAKESSTAMGCALFQTLARLIAADLRILDLVPAFPSSEPTRSDIQTQNKLQRTAQSRL